MSRSVLAQSVTPAAFSFSSHLKKLGLVHTRSRSQFVQRSGRDAHDRQST